MFPCRLAPPQRVWLVRSPCAQVLVTVVLAGLLLLLRVLEQMRRPGLSVYLAAVLLARAGLCCFVQASRPLIRKLALPLSKVVRQGNRQVMLLSLHTKLLTFLVQVSLCKPAQAVFLLSAPIQT
jgi:F0F1-type ATP synthase membrane subunit a